MASGHSPESRELVGSDGGGGGGGGNLSPEQDRRDRVEGGGGGSSSGRQSDKATAFDIDDEFEDETTLFAAHDEASADFLSPRRKPRQRRLAAAIIVGGFLLLVAVVAVLVLLETTARPTLKKCVPQTVDIPRVDQLTLEEKVGQMMQIDQLAIKDRDDVAKYFLGSVLSGGGGAPTWGNKASDWADMVDDLQARAQTTRLKIPIVYGADAVHGHNNVYGATIFPHHVALGATREPAVVQQIAAATAKEVMGTGVRWTFSPAVTVCRDPRWGRCYESFAELSTVVEPLAVAEIMGWQSTPTDPEKGPTDAIFISATAKHFVGDGGTKGGVDRGDTECSEEELRSIHLPPYASAVSVSVGSVMVSYSSWNGVPMHENKYLITDVLRDEMGFGGVVVSDWEAIQLLPGNFSEQVRKAINAGIDMVMVPRDYKAFAATLIEEVNAGRVSMDRIDDAVARVLGMKMSLGLFQNACAQRDYMVHVGSDEHRQLARGAVRRSLVLLKNERRRANAEEGGSGEQGEEKKKKSGAMFPLPLGRKEGDAAGGMTSILVVGRHADDVGLQCGGWTIKWQGQAGAITPGTTILQGIREVVDDQAEVKYLASDDGSTMADYAVVVVGEDPYAEYYGDSKTLAFNDTNAALVETVCGRMPCVVVLISGRVLDISAILPKVDGFVAAWLPGSEGAGVADVLFSDKHDFQGKLPFTWFRSVDQLPLNFGSFPYEPLFPYGHGLDKDGNQLFLTGLP